MGILGVIYNIELTSLASYFISLTGFIGAYIFGESVRRGNESSIFLSGPSDRREIMTYIIISFWLIIGVFSVVNHKDLLEISAYFAALTPFVGSYILGETYKKDGIGEIEEIEEIEQINS
jgi:hypothetical protein